MEKKKPIKVKISEENEYALIELVEEKEEPKSVEKTESKVEEKKVEKEGKTPEKTETKTKEEELKREVMKTAPIDMIETDIDRLYELLTENWTPMTDLAEKLNVDVDRVESWSKILEERDLVEIDYPIIGIPRVRKKVWKKKKS